MRRSFSRTRKGGANMVEAPVFQTLDVPAHTPEIYIEIPTGRIVVIQSW
jgi:hypothetical protein